MKTSKLCFLTLISTFILAGCNASSGKCSQQIYSYRYHINTYNKVTGELICDISADSTENQSLHQGNCKIEVELISGAFKSNLTVSKAGYITQRLSSVPYIDGRCEYSDTKEVDVYLEPAR